MVDDLNGKVVDMGQKTLRDEIAIEAMKGIIAINKDMNVENRFILKTLSSWSYEIADAMMKERNKNG